MSKEQSKALQCSEAGLSKRNRRAQAAAQVIIVTKLLTLLIFGFGCTSLLLSFDFIQTMKQDRFVHGYIRTQESEVQKLKNRNSVYKSNAFSKNRTRSKPFHSIRILCWVMTGPHNHQSRAAFVKKTWGSRCTKLVFMSSQNDTELGAVGLPNVQEGRDWIWWKTREAFKYVWSNHKDDADWFFKADDDTYAIMENLRYLLKNYNSSKPYFLGCRFKSKFAEYKHGYMSGGAGYVLSKEAVRRFVELPKEHKCFTTPHGNEDEEIAKCLEDVDVIPEDTRDEVGRARFVPFFPEHLIAHNYAGTNYTNFWYWQYIYYPQKSGRECCSDTAVSFHYMSPAEIYLMEYLVYRLKPFGYPAKSLLYNPYY